MANFITTKVTVGKDKIEQVLSKIKGYRENDLGIKEDIVDFEKIIPMPLHIFRGDLGQEQKEKYGKDNWYDWSIEKWGTKWNSWNLFYSTMYDKDAFEFQTAWNCPIPVIKQMSKMFPDIEFDIKYSDEDISSRNHGHFIIKDGEVEDLTEDIADLQRFACEIQGRDYDEWLNDNE